MFWSLVLQPGKTYSSVVEESFHLSMAAIDTKTMGKNDSSVFPVQVKADGQELVLCNLSHTCLQMNLNLEFLKGSKLSFFTSGKATIHLTGYLLLEQYSEDEVSSDDSTESSDVEEKEDSLVTHKKTGKPVSKKTPDKRKSDLSQVGATKKAKLDDEDSLENEYSYIDEFNDEELGDFGWEDDDDVDEADDSDDDEDHEEDDSSDDDEDRETDDSDDEEDDVAIGSTKKKDDALKKKDAAKKNNAPKKNDSPKKSDASKKNDSPKKSDSSKRNEAPVTPKSNKKTPVTDGKQIKTPISNKKQDDKLNKSNLQQSNGVTPKSDQKNKKKKPKPEIKNPKPQTLQGGVVFEELREGEAEASVARPGKTVEVYYTGRLKHNGRVFDESKTFPGFKFKLGRGEVIKGWDVGLNGMRVGSKRRIMCPPEMAYGAKGSPPSIPPNSTLVFDIELRRVS